jgi:YD repeat-containing protein
MAYEEALRLARASPAVQAAIGENIHIKSTVIGLALRNQDSEFVQFSVALAGSKGSGHLYAVANSLHRTPEFSRLSFLPAAGTQYIDLTPAPQRLDMPPASTKKVYIFPVGLDLGEPLNWVPPYYYAKLGIEVEVLPPTPLAENLINPKRRQVDAEACVEYLRKSHPELDADPSAIVVAVTSKDIYIPSFRWTYAENYRTDGRFAVVSSARLHPAEFMAHWNPEWLHSRLQKMLTKNIVMLYFDLPMSSDYTSMLSGGVLSGSEVDLMGARIIGVEGFWDSFIDGNVPTVTSYSIPDKPSLWRLTDSDEALPQPFAHVFRAYLANGLFVDRTTDFRLEGEYPLQFTRSYRNQDTQSRSFGIGTSDSLDIFLVGQMSVYVDLIYENGGRLHFAHVPPKPFQTGYVGNEYVANGALAVYTGDGWTVTRRDRSKLYFPFRPNAISRNVTVLTGYTDPAGHKYEMQRNSAGDLLSMATPAGQWLRFEPDAAHRFHRISASTGRVVTYDYDTRGRLCHVVDSDGHTESYTYDDSSEMLTISQGSSTPVIKNGYDASGHVISQTLATGEKFLYHYVAVPQGRGNALVPDLITDPRGFLTHLQYGVNGYKQSLPEQPASLAAPH